jgi:hypothetical protein
MNQKDFPENERLAFATALYGCGFFALALMLVVMLLLLSGCTTTRYVNNDTTHLSREMLTQMDSIFSSRMVIRQDSSFRESVLRQLQSIVEKSDTSRYVVTDTSGNVIRERIVINNVREVTSETEHHEREVIMRRLETIDSTLTAMQRQIEKTDSLVANKETIVEVPAELTWWQQLRIHLGGITFWLIIILCGWNAVRLWRRFI